MGPFALLALCDPVLPVRRRCLSFFRLYQSKWRFASLPDLVAIAKAAGVLALAMLVIDYVVLAQDLYGGYFFGRQAIAIYFGVQMALLGGPRLIYRYWKDSRAMSSPSRREDAPTLLLGRPSDIEVLLRAIETGAVRNMRPVAILSPREIDLGQVIRGVKVTATSPIWTTRSRRRGRGTRRSAAS